jgi:hypothetical protein
MLAHFWRLAFADVQIGTALIDNHAEKLIKISHHLMTKSE